MGNFGQDINGAFRRLEDGRVLRINKRMFNTLLSLSASVEAPVWLEGW